MDILHKANEWLLMDILHKANEWITIKEYVIIAS